MKKNDFSNVFAAGLQGISRIIIDFKIDQKRFTKYFRFSLAHTAKKLFPKETVTNLAHKTGMLRSQIDDALERNNPIPILDQEALILTRLWKAKDENNLVSIDSVKSIISTQLKGKYSISTIINSLIESGSVVERDNYLEVLHKSFISNKSEERILEMLGFIIDKLSSTIIFNKKAKLKEHRFFQRIFKTTQVHPSNFEKMHKELHTVISKKHWPEIKAIIEKYESNVPENTFPECGLTIFEFNDKLSKNKKGEDNE